MYVEVKGHQTLVVRLGGECTVCMDVGGSPLYHVGSGEPNSGCQAVWQVPFLAEAVPDLDFWVTEL